MLTGGEQGAYVSHREGNLPIGRELWATVTGDETLLIYIEVIVLAHILSRKILDRHRKTRVSRKLYLRQWAPSEGLQLL
jgi:hypothetical protein